MLLFKLKRTITQSPKAARGGHQEHKKRRVPKASKKKMLIIPPEAPAWHGGDNQKDDVERKQSNILQSCLDISQGFFWKNPVGYCKHKSKRDPVGVQTKNAKNL